MGWGGESAHVDPDLGDDHRSGGVPDPGISSSWVTARAQGGGDLLADLVLQRGEVEVDRVDPAQPSSARTVSTRWSMEAFSMT
jgi:hypothetical protein